MHIRDASRSDIPGILAIYNDVVTNSTAIWDEIEVDVANRQSWLEQRVGAGYPVLVAIDGDGNVIGYASFADWRAWSGYRHSVEHSIYIRADQRGNGVGKALMQALIERARQLGKHVLVAGIEAKNSGSIRFHQRLGFEEAGCLREVGTKFDRWLDLTFMQLMLDRHAEPNKK